MNHDITHCDGENCQVRETCHRYVAHLDLKKTAQEGEPQRKYPSYLVASTCIGEGLEMYWGENYQIKC